MHALTHNDAQGRICAPHLAGLGVNLFNFSHEHSLAEMREWTGGEITLLGNVPPRDVMASGTPDDVRRTVEEAIDSLDDTRRLILSCGGGMPPQVSTENIQAFLDAAVIGFLTRARGHDGHDGSLRLAVRYWMTQELSSASPAV